MTFSDVLQSYIKETDKTYPNLPLAMANLILQLQDQVATIQASSGGTNSQNSNYTAAVSDNGKLISFNTSSAAISFIQSALGTSASVTMSAVPKTGDLLIVIVPYATTSVVATLLGGGVTSWTEIESVVPIGNGDYISIFYGVVGNSPSATITSTNATGGLYVWNFRGCAASPLDSQNSATGNSTVQQVSVTVSSNGELVFAYVAGSETPGPFTVNDGFTTIPSTGNANNWVIYKLNASAGIAIPGVTDADSGSFAAIGASFKAGASLILTLPLTPISATWRIFVENIGTGILSINPNGSLLDGSSEMITGIMPNQGLYITTDGLSYFTMRG